MKMITFQNTIRIRKLSLVKIDRYYASPDKHFLHNFITQHNEAQKCAQNLLSRQIRIQIYSDKSESEDLFICLLCLRQKHLQGHSLTVLRGLFATQIDNAFGQFSFGKCVQLPTATANFNIVTGNL
ncbi:unnamed protein product [Paramecium octaurelia]|uniref:ERp29 N-terminal domain-containing protein n=1 Tax=Paramecium octaurelia TaxID=43137 RepID=A0A8S1TAZ7_PAROT|nr:unnamed protein product [Paramecium octaurelia]